MTQNPSLRNLTIDSPDHAGYVDWVMQQVEDKVEKRLSTTEGRDLARWLAPWFFGHEDWDEDAFDMWCAKVAAVEREASNAT